MGVGEGADVIPLRCIIVIMGIYDDKERTNGGMGEGRTEHIERQSSATRGRQITFHLPSPPERKLVPSEWKFQSLNEFGERLNDGPQSSSLVNQSRGIILMVHKQKI